MARDVDTDPPPEDDPWHKALPNNMAKKSQKKAPKDKSNDKRTGYDQP